MTGRHHACMTAVRKIKVTVARVRCPAENNERNMNEEEKISKKQKKACTPHKTRKQACGLAAIRVRGSDTSHLRDRVWQPTSHEARIIANQTRKKCKLKVRTAKFTGAKCNEGNHVQ
jgi:hypothetical protein